MKKTIIISLIVALVSLTLGYLFGSISSSNSQIGSNSSSGLSQLAGGNNTFQAGWEAAKARLAESGFFPAMGNLEVKLISGEVKKVEGEKITIKIRPLEPLADSSLDERVIIVSGDTKIYQLEPKDQKIYQKEMEEFNRKMQEPAKTTTPGQFTPPEFFTKKITVLGEIKIGQQLTVTAADNIKEAKEIKALEISLQPAPSSIPGAANLPLAVPPAPPLVAPAAPASIK